MATASEFLVSTSGQMSVPAAVRRRWGLEHGGQVTVVDVGEALIVLPADARRKLLAAALSSDEHLQHVRSLDDPDTRSAVLAERAFLAELGAGCASWPLKLWPSTTTRPLLAYAAYVGVIFAGGPRQLTLERAEEVLGDLPGSVRRVGVFGTDDDDAVARAHGERVGGELLERAALAEGRAGHARILCAGMFQLPGLDSNQQPSG